MTVVNDLQPSCLSGIVSIYLEAVTFQTISESNLRRINVLRMFADECELCLVTALQRKIEMNQIELTPS